MRNAKFVIISIILKTDNMEFQFLKYFFLFYYFSAQTV